MIGLIILLINILGGESAQQLTPVLEQLQAQEPQANAHKLSIALELQADFMLDFGCTTTKT